MMSLSENEAVNATAFNLFTGHFVKFGLSFCLKTDHFTDNFGTYAIEHVSCHYNKDICIVLYCIDITQPPKESSMLKVKQINRLLK